jgi:hypothetical protein
MNNPLTPPKSGFVLTDRIERQSTMIRCSCLQGLPESNLTGFLSLIIELKRFYTHYE